MNKRTSHTRANSGRALALAAVLCLAMSPRALIASARASTAGHFELEIGNARAGYLKSVDGGFTRTDVAAQVGTAAGPLAIQVAVAPGPALDWIAEALHGGPAVRSGAIVSYDDRGVATSRLEFTGALITEVTFPAFDASSQEPAYIAIAFEPESVRIRPASGSIAEGLAEPPGVAAYNYVLSLDGLDCGVVSKIGSFTVEPSGQAWSNDPVERSGELALVDHSSGATLLTIPLQDVGIGAITLDTATTADVSKSELEIER